MKTTTQYMTPNEDIFIYIYLTICWNFVKVCIKDKIMIIFISNKNQ